MNPAPGGDAIVPQAIDRVEVSQQLERIFASPHLRNSKRCQTLLSFVVEAALEGELDRIKERTLGVEVFGRDPDYDTNQDSVVRNAAIEIRIVLPQGSYVPEFRRPEPQSHHEVIGTPPSAAKHRRLWWRARWARTQPGPPLPAGRPRAAPGLRHCAALRRTGDCR
jgi:hypothetical protein